MGISREQLLRYRVQAQQLNGGRRHLDDLAVLDLGVQDTGPGGAGWAMAVRGLPTSDLAEVPEQLVLAWTLRGAPHFYRRREVAGVAAATAPWSKEDAAKRIFDAAKPLRAAGIDPLEALDVVAGQMREIVTEPTVKGEMSGALAGRLTEPYLRHCRPCDAIHASEQLFRLAALRAGLELLPGTSPPVLRRIPGWKGAAKQVPDTLDVVRACLRLLGPTTPQLVAGYVDAPVKEVKRRWPADVVEVDVAGEARWVLADDLASLRTASVDPRAVRLLAPYDLFLQARDRELLVPDAARRKQLWVVLGRPGAVLVGAEIAGSWRPRAAGKKLKLHVERWGRVPEEALVEQAEHLAAHRGATFAGLADA